MRVRDRCIAGPLPSLAAVLVDPGITEERLSVADPQRTVLTLRQPPRLELVWQALRWTLHPRSGTGMGEARVSKSSEGRSDVAHAISSP